MAKFLILRFKLLSFVGEDKSRKMKVFFSSSRGISVSYQGKKKKEHKPVLFK